MHMKKTISKIERHYLCHGVHIKLILLSNAEGHGRIIFRVKLKPGTKEHLVFDRAPDIKTALQLPLFQPFKYGLDIRLAISEKPVMQNSLLMMLQSQKFIRSKAYLPVALGYDMMCEMAFADLAKMPHAMYAGSSNSGKSVGLICLILSLIMKQPVAKVNLVLFDVGANTLGLFGDIPHLSYPIVKDTDTGIYVVHALVDEMEKRIKLEQAELLNLPAIVCIIDEYVSFISNIHNRKQSSKLANEISDLLRRGRHAKIHMVLATQNPTRSNMKVDTVNITTRMAFTCADIHHSIAILNERGAEKLPGKGAMLYKSTERPNPIQLQGAYISPREAEGLINKIKALDYDCSNKFLVPEFDSSEAFTELFEDSNYADDENGRQKELVIIIMWVLEHNTVSANKLKQHFSMGNRVNRIMDILSEMGLLSLKHYNQPRKVIPEGIGDIPENIMNLLMDNGIKYEEIINALNNRAERCPKIS